MTSLRSLEIAAIAAACSLMLTTYALAHGDHIHGATTKAGKKSKMRDHSAWTVGAGVSASKQFDQLTPHGHDTNSTSGASTQQGSATGGGHSHLRLLHGDEDHSGSGSSNSGASSANSSDPHKTPIVIGVNANVAYMLSRSWSLGLVGGYDDRGGIQDPVAQIILRTSMSRSLTWVSILGFAAPVSKASKESYKITTANLSTGPELRSGPWTTQLAAKLSSSWYSKTVLTEQEAKSEGMSLAGSQSDLSLHGGDEHTSSSTSSTGASTSPTSNREFNRYGGGAASSYKFSSNWKLGTGGGVAYVERQFGPELYETTASVVQVSALIDDVTGSLAFQLSALDESIAVPSTPVVVAGVEWTSH